MNIILKKPVAALGYNFILAAYLPANKDEYHLRNRQHDTNTVYRNLSATELESLIHNRNTADDWNKLLVADAFNADLVKNCKFYGLVRIGKLEPYYLEFNNLRIPVGLYNSTIVSCDFGDNVVVDNVDYIAHYIIGNEVMIVNVNEMATTAYAKFGNGIVKEGEPEKSRIRLEVCNENGGRAIIPFNGMLPGDAFLWSRYRDDELLQNKLTLFTENIFDKQRGYYGMIGDRTVIKNCKIIKDVLIGSDAYLKGANKLKNLTINSSPDAKSQVGEGCELVNGIIGVGCRIFYGVKAVRFVMASHSQLKYGARLINSYLGNNATISCCEVLNALIFPAHEQHHNNSFLCAALVMGQSNIAAGATIGSNHNSRSADGELVAGRGFWPGLCTSLKHNSKFASFTIIAKGDYPAELNITIPFSLVSNDVSTNRLVIMPGYWFMYNMYALARNAWKYVDRDRRKESIQLIEYDFLAPDSINEIVDALQVMITITGTAYHKHTTGDEAATTDAINQAGRRLLEEKDPVLNTLEITAEGFENARRKTVVVKVAESYHIFKNMVKYHAAAEIVRHITTNNITTAGALVASIPAATPLTRWCNIGGQLIIADKVERLIQDIHTGKVSSWHGIHDFYTRQGKEYAGQKLHHALAALSAVFAISLEVNAPEVLKALLLQSISIKEWMCESIFTSRAKDYSNPFRKIVYDNPDEMNMVLGKLDNNTFILQEQAALELYRKTVEDILERFGL